MRAAGIRDKGKVRESNEDHYVIFLYENLELYAVADGMGGHAAGGLASKASLDFVCRYLGEQQGIDDMELSSLVAGMLAFANSRVYDISISDKQYNGMGTTLTLLLKRGVECCIGHIGDSRAYVINLKGIEIVTKDHTLVSQLVQSGEIGEEERDSHPQRHVLTRALGTDSEVSFDVSPLFCRPGDAILLCSDGLHGLVEKSLMRQIVQETGDPQEALQRLVDAANDQGGTDNITAVLVYY